MRIEPDDPILTAYALCELDEASFARVEEALKDSPEARQEVDEILRAGSWLSQGLAAEPAPRLEEWQRAVLETAAISSADKIVRVSWRRVTIWGGLAAAACLALALLVPGLWTHTREPGGASDTAAVVPAPPAAASPANGATSTPPLLAKVEPPADPPPEQPGTGYRMDPRLLERYGLRPRSGQPSIPSEIPDEARARYPGGQRYGGPRYSANFGPAASTGPGTASYPRYAENRFRAVLEHPLSTFSIDVDTASYANVRRFLNQGQLPPRDAVRIEEMINYFSYQYPQPRGDDPFSVNIEAATCPWNVEHRLVRIGLQGRTLSSDARPPSNLVFLIDVSGSMQPLERLPLIKQALRVLVKRMNESDRVAMVVYAGHSRVVLPSTSCEQKEIILAAIDSLQAGGTTNGGAGIQEAYRVAVQHFIPGGVNRVILCTDGDFNVGVTSQAQLIQLIREKARSGVFLTTLGVGTDNYKDALMQRLADHGNGNYHYLDSLEEAQKVLIEQMNANLVTIAKDVKIQVEFNPALVHAYRLVGYEKRVLENSDFRDDSKDAGEVGAGHSVTTLYEIVPATRDRLEAASELKYQRSPFPTTIPAGESKELLTLKLRYKQPNRDTSELREWAFTSPGQPLAEASTDFKFAAAVAAFGMLLQGSELAGQSSYENVLALAQQAKGSDQNGSRAEFLNLVRRAQELSERTRSLRPSAFE